MGEDYLIIEAVEKEKKFYRILTFGIFTIEFVYAMAGTVWSVLLPYLMTYYNKNYTDIGAATAFYGVGSILSVLSLMYLLDRFKKPKVLAVILIVFFVGIFIQGLAPTFYLLPVAYLIAGSAGMAMDTVNSAIIVDIYGEKSKTYLNVLQGVFGAGSIIGPLYAQLIINSGMQWNSTYIITSMIIAVLFVVYSILLFTHKDAISRLHHTSAPKKTETELSIVQFVKRKEVIVTIAAMFFIMGAQNLTSGWLVKYVKDGMGAADYLGTFAVMSYFIGVTSTRFLTPLLYKKLEPLKILMILLACGSVVLFSVYLTNNPYILPLGTFLGGFGMGTATPSIVANLCAVFPGQSGRASSFAFLGLGFSGVVFSFLGAAIITAFGLKAGVMLATILMMCAIPLIFTLLRFKKAQNASDSIEICECEEFENEIHEPII